MRPTWATLVLAALPACLQPPPRSTGDASAAEPDGEPGDGSAGYRRKITVNADLVDEDVLDFPLLVTLADDAGLAAHARADGLDLVFRNPAGDLLPFERQAWDPGTGTLRAWVRTSILSGAGAELYLHYGDDSAVDRSDAPAAWSNGFEAVWHLEEAPASITDASGNGHDVVAVAGSTATMEGYVGNATFFDGSDDFLSFGSAFPTGVDAGDRLTVTAWARYDSLGQYDHFIAKGNGNANGWGIGVDSGPDFLVRAMNGDQLERGWNTAARPALGTWYHWALVYDGTQADDATRLRGFRNGGEFVLTYDAAIPATFDSAGGDLYIGCAPWNTPQYCIDGAVDEVRVSTVPRSAAWIAAEYKNQVADGSVPAIGSEEKL